MSETISGKAHRCIKCRRLFEFPQQYTKDRRWARKGGYGIAYLCRNTSECAMRVLKAKQDRR